MNPDHGLVLGGQLARMKGACMASEYALIFPILILHAGCKQQVLESENRKRILFRLQRIGLSGIAGHVSAVNSRGGAGAISRVLDYTRAGV